MSEDNEVEPGVAKPQVSVRPEEPVLQRGFTPDEIEQIYKAKPGLQFRFTAEEIEERARELDALDIEIVHDTHGRLIGRCALDDLGYPYISDPRSPGRLQEMLEVALRSEALHLINRLAEVHEKISEKKKPSDEDKKMVAHGLLLLDQPLTDYTELRRQHAELIVRKLRGEE